MYARSVVQSLVLLQVPMRPAVVIFCEPGHYTVLVTGLITATKTITSEQCTLQCLQLLPYPPHDALLRALLLLQHLSYTNNEVRCLQRSVVQSYGSSYRFTYCLRWIVYGDLDIYRCL